MTNKYLEKIAIYINPKKGVMEVAEQSKRLLSETSRRAAYFLAHEASKPGTVLSSPKSLQRYNELVKRQRTAFDGVMEAGNKYLARKGELRQIRSKAGKIRTG